MICSGSGSRQYLSVFQKKIAQHFSFYVSEAACFPESWSHFHILTFLLYFMFDPESNLDPEP
jgi:hypothetical protein